MNEKSDNASSSLSGVTALLDAIRNGDVAARERLVMSIYDDLRAIARSLMVRENPANTLQATALVHEGLVKMFGSDAFADAPDRGALIGRAATAMRQVLIDAARARKRQKRGGGKARERLDDWLDQLARKGFDPAADLEALEVLNSIAPRQATIATLRYEGYTNPEIASLLDVSLTTVEGDLRQARKVLVGRRGGDAKEKDGAAEA